MVKELVHLSDWIQNLISIKNLSFTLIGMLSSGIIAISTILLNFSSSLNFVAFIELNLIDYSFAIIALWLTFSKKSPLNRANKLFAKIMQNPGEIEVNEIRKEWYGGIKKMNKINYGKWEMTFLYIALILSLLSLIFVIIGVSFKENGASFLSLFIFLLPIALAFFSLHFASHSIVIADESDRKMQGLAEYSFVEKDAMLHGYKSFFDSLKLRTTLSPIDVQIIEDNLDKLTKDVKATSKLLIWVKDEKNIFINDFILLTGSFLYPPILGQYNQAIKDKYKAIIDEAILFEYRINDLEQLKNSF